MFAVASTFTSSANLNVFYHPSFQRKHWTELDLRWFPADLWWINLIMSCWCSPSGYGWIPRYLGMGGHFGTHAEELLKPYEINRAKSGQVPPSVLSKSDQIWGSSVPEKLCLLPVQNGSKTIAFFGNWKQPESQSHETSSSYKLASVWVRNIAVKGSEDEKGQKTFERKVWTKAQWSQWKLSDW